MTEIMRLIVFHKGGAEGIERKIIGKMVRRLLVRSGRKSKYDENRQQETKNVEERPKRSRPYQERFE